MYLRLGTRLHLLLAKGALRKVTLKLSSISLTPLLRSCIDESTAVASAMGSDFASVEHLLLAILKHKHNPVAAALTELGVDERLRDLLTTHLLDSPHWATNVVRDEDGVLIGYMVEDQENNPLVVDRSGQPIYEEDRGKAAKGPDSRDGDFAYREEL